MAQSSSQQINNTIYLPSSSLPRLGKEAACEPLSCCSCTKHCTPVSECEVNPATETLQPHRDWMFCHTNYPRALAASNTHHFKHILEYKCSVSSTPRVLSDSSLPGTSHTVCTAGGYFSFQKKCWTKPESPLSTGRAQFSKAWEFFFFSISA